MSYTVQYIYQYINISYLSKLIKNNNHCKTNVLDEHVSTSKWTSRYSVGSIGGLSAHSSQQSLIVVHDFLVSPRSEF